MVSNLTDSSNTFKSNVTLWRCFKKNHSTEKLTEFERIVCKKYCMSTIDTVLKVHS